MRPTPHLTDLPWRSSPLAVAASWPAEQPMMMLHSGRTHPRWARWTILALPRARYRFDGRSRWIGELPSALADIRFTHDPLVDLDCLLRTTSISNSIATSIHGPGVTSGGWIGSLAYDLGRWIEPRACALAADQFLCSAEARAARKPTTPSVLIDLAWCPDMVVYDHLNRQWHAVGEPPMNPPRPLTEFEGDYRLARWKPDADRDAYLRRVAHTRAAIAAGDIFQANIAQRFTAPFDGSARSLALHAMRRTRPWYGSLLELDDGTSARRVISLSPELFIELDAKTRRVITRPIKGTRPSCADASGLMSSAKDAAELHMIIDLMRNDLSRVCEYGSVRVAQAREIETHPTVHHGVGEVTGTLRRDVSFGELLAATFPPGSVTGVPKIRAMQIIDSLEPFERGPYCGAIGLIGDDGDVRLSVAIRTLVIEGQRDVSDAQRLRGIATYCAGAGIVSDSDPMAEHRETLDKTAAAWTLVNDSTETVVQTRAPTRRTSLQRR